MVAKSRQGVLGGCASHSHCSGPHTIVRPSSPALQLLRGGPSLVLQLLLGGPSPTWLASQDPTKGKRSTLHEVGLLSLPHHACRAP